MQSTEEKASLGYDNILVSPQGFAEVSGGKLVILVPLAEINGITLRFGRPEHNPMVSLLIGAAFVVIGICGLVGLFLAPRGFRYEVGMMIFGAMGASIIFDALKKRFYLEVHGRKGIRRLVFSKKATLTEIQDYFARVKDAYNYQIVVDARKI